MKTVYLVLLLSVCSIFTFAQSEKLDHSLYSLEYPSSWQLDAADPDYNPDAFFTIDASEDNYFMFFIFDQEVNSDTVLNTFVTNFSAQALTSIIDESDFKTWGSFTGSGQGLKAKLINGRTAIFRIFCWTTGGKTFLLCAQMLESDSDKFSNGFALIEKSFRLK